MKKRLLTAIMAAVLLSLAAAALFGPAGNGFPLKPRSAKASSLQESADKDFIVYGTRPPMQVITDWHFQTSTPPPVTDPPITDPPVTDPQVTDPPVTKRPDGQKTSSGHFMTSEGPLFLSFRQELTDKLYMFTPMDLSLDGEYHFPLIGDTGHVVGEAKVVVQSGMTIVTYLLVNGVNLDEKEEFFTFFRDIDSPKSLKTSKLQSVKLKFGMSYSITKWLDSDPNVLLYINCPVSYKSNLSGLTPFSFQDPDYLSRMMALLPLMD